MSDTDHLALLLTQHQIKSINMSHVDCWCGWTWEPTPKPGEASLYRDFLGHVAAVVAESGWLRDARAEAWDKGHENCRCACNDGANWTRGGLPCPACTNPYRTTEDTNNTTDRT